MKSCVKLSLWENCNLLQLLLQLQPELLKIYYLQLIIYLRVAVTKSVQINRNLKTNFSLEDKQTFCQLRNVKVRAHKYNLYFLSLHLPQQKDQQKWCIKHVQMQVKRIQIKALKSNKERQTMPTE